MAAPTYYTADMVRALPEDGKGRKAFAALPAQVQEPARHAYRLGC